jgi:hypothetical protein
VSKSYEIEYCNLNLRFDRRLIRNFIKSLIQAGYSLYWSENENFFTVSIRSNRRLIKLRFTRFDEYYEISGNYTFTDNKLAHIIEKWIEDTRGHAVVKRFKDQQITIENIMNGEMIRMVEINGVDHKVVYQRESVVTMEAVMNALHSDRAEKRIEEIKTQMDELLVNYKKAIDGQQDSLIKKIQKQLSALRHEMITLEM